MLANPAHQLTTVAAVHPDEAQFLAPSAQPLEDQTRAVAFLHRGGADHDQQEQAEGIDQQMPLAPLDLFGCVIPSDAFDLGGLDALAIQTARRRVLVASGSLTHTSAHGVMQTLPVAAQAPPAE